jgi:hypothetical protein
MEYTDRMFVRDEVKRTLKEVVVACLKLSHHFCENHKIFPTRQPEFQLGKVSTETFYQ